jgi:hypothetical protein
MALVIFTATQRNQPDLAGFAVPVKREDDQGNAYTSTVYTLPALFDEVQKRINEGYEKVVVLIDELMSCDNLMKKALSSFISDRAIGGFTLPDNCYLFATGNRQNDRAGVTQTPMQLLNRMSMIEVVPDYEGWRPWAVAHGIHPLYLTAMEQHESAFISQSVPAEPRPYPTLRSFYYAHEAHMAGIPISKRDDTLELPTDDLSQALIAGFIGIEASGILIEHLANWQHLPTRKEVETKPTTCKCPDMTNLAAVYTASELVVSMADNKANMDNIWKFAERLPQEIITRTAQNVLRKDRRILTSSKTFRDWANNNGELLAEVLGD